MKIILYIFLLINTLIASTQNNKLENVTIQFQWLDQFEFAGYYIAKEKGYYKDLGLNVKFDKYKYNIDITKKVLNNNATYGIGGSDLIVELAKHKSLELLYSTFQSSPLVFLATEESNIKTIEDFKNKRIMLTPNIASSSIFNALLKQHNLNLSDMTLLAHNFNIDDLIEKKTDLYQAYLSNEPYTLISKGINPIIFDPKDYGFDTYSNIVFTSKNEIKYHKQRALNFKKASIKGWEYAFLHINETVNLILKKYNTQNKSRDALIYEAKVLKKLAYADNQPFGKLDLKKLYRIYDLYNLMGFIKNKKLNIANFIVKDTIDTNKNKNIYFTMQEQEWINTHIVNIATTKNWEPFTFNNKYNQISGISMDYWHLIAKRSGLKFKIHEIDNFTDVLNSIKTKKYDITIATTKTKERSNYAIFTNTYEKFPIAIATKKEQNYIAKLDMLNGKKIAVGKNYSAYKLIKNKFPKIEFVFTKDTTEALRLVSQGDVFAAVDIEPALFYQIQTNDFSNLRIVGSTNINFNLQIMIRDDYILLQSILNKTISSISKEEMITIYKKWVTLDSSYNSNYEIAKNILYVIIVILLIMSYRQYTMKKYTRELQKNVKLALKDTTEKNIALLKEQKKLEESVLNFQYLLDIAMEAIVILDEDRNIIQLNLAGLKMFGAKNLNNILGLHINVFIPEYESKKLADAYIKNKAEPYEIDLYRLDKTIFPALVSGRNIIKNGIKQRITTIIDLSDIKRKDELIEQQSKLALMGEMISMIAHQWRQPLNIIGVINMKIETKLEFQDSITADEYEPVSRDITKQLEFMSKTIDDFRSFFKPQKELNSTTLDTLVNSTLGIIEASVINKNIELIKELNCDVTINTYSNELMQVILNIIKNAEDILIEKDIQNPYIKLISYNKDNKSILKIIDNGGGIPESIVSKIFDPYFSTKLEKHGTGLGLYMSKTIVEDHCKGTLTVINDNNNAVFKMTLSSI